MEFIHTYPPPGNQTTSSTISTGLHQSSGSNGRTLPIPQLETINGPYSLEFDYVQFYGTGTGTFNRQQIAPSSSVPPTRQSVPLTPSTQRLHSELSYMADPLPLSFGDARIPWSSAQPAATQTGQMLANQGSNNTSSGSGHDLNRSDNRNTRLQNTISSIESHLPTNTAYLPSDRNTSPAYLGRGFQASFVRSSAHHSSQFRYPTASNNWEVAR